MLSNQEIKDILSIIPKEYDDKPFQYFPKERLTVDICKIAVAIYPPNITDVPDEFKIKEVCEIALEYATEDQLQDLLGAIPIPEITLEILKQIEEKKLLLPFIAKPPMKFTSEIIEELIRINPQHISFLPENLPIDGRIIPYEERRHFLECTELSKIPDYAKTEFLCYCAVNYDERNLIDVPEHCLSERIYLSAVEQDYRNFYSVKEEFMTEAICLAGIEGNPTNIQFVPENLLTSQIIMTAFSEATTRKVNLFSYGKNRYSETVLLEVIKNFPQQIKNFPEHQKTAKICEIAVKADVTNIFHVPPQYKTYELCKVVLDNLENISREELNVYSLVRQIPYPDLLFNFMLRDWDEGKIEDIVEAIPRKLINRNIVFEAIAQNPKNIPLLPTNLLPTQREIDDIYDISPESYRDLPIEQKTEFVSYVAARRFPVVFNDIPENVLTECVIMAALTANPHLICSIKQQDRTREMYLKAFEASLPNVYQVFSVIPKEYITEEMCFLGLCKDRRIIETIPEDFRNEKLFAEALLKSMYIDYNSRNEFEDYWILKHIPYPDLFWIMFDYFSTDLELTTLLEITPPDFIDAERAERLIQIDGHSIAYIPQNLHTGPLIRKAIAQSGGGVLLHDNIREDFKQPEFYQLCVEHSFKSFCSIPSDKLTPQLCLTAYKLYPDMPQEKIPPHIRNQPNVFTLNQYLEETTGQRFSEPQINEMFEKKVLKKEVSQYLSETKMLNENPIKKELQKRFLDKSNGGGPTLKK